ncbi:MAG: hypothetical protein K0B81_03065 [Candidatus Cloacimonetes bacterium]|nr:hypothetical protein [Candidatus Cloacimonadota bacterium]
MKNIFLCIILIALVGHLFSYSLYENYELGIGKRITHLDARSAAMGGTGTASGTNIFDGMLNPANIGFLNDGLGFQFVFDVTQLEENRSMPMWNFFDSYVDDATYVSNTNFFTDFGLAMSYKHRFGNLSIAGALDYKPFVNFDAYYEEQVRNNEGSDNDNYPPLLATNFLENDGNIYSYGVTAAFTYHRYDILFNETSLGFNLNMLSGKSRSERKIIWSDYSKDAAVVDDYEIRWGYDYSGLNFSIGLKSEISQRISAGIMYAPKFEMTVEDAFSDLDHDFDYPASLRLGVQYRPRNVLRTTFHFDLEFVNWSDISDFYDNVMNYYLGVEHIFPHAVPLRLGFSYVTSPSSSETDIPSPIINPIISAGTGFRIYGDFFLDLSGEFTHRKYDTMDLFPDGYYNYSELWNNYTPENRTEPDTVREYYVRVKSSLTFKW